jgi:hypothetical protein
MGRPRKLNEALLKKIALKKGRASNIRAIAKQADAKARRVGVSSSSIALILMARELGIGTATATSRLSDAEKSELRSTQTATTSSQPARAPSQSILRRSEVPVTKILQYDTDDHFIKGHIDEINRAYNAKCYTSVFILCRKVLENLIIDILKKKFPEKTQKNKELYFDTAQHRLKDFDVILKNFHSKRNDFGTENKAVAKLYGLASALKNDANEKTHSWYHLVEHKTEIEKLGLEPIFELIKRLETNVGIR